MQINYNQSVSRLVSVTPSKILFKVCIIMKYQLIFFVSLYFHAGSLTLYLQDNFTTSQIRMNNVGETAAIGKFYSFGDT